MRDVTNAKVCVLLCVAALASACALVIKDPFADRGNSKLMPGDMVSRAAALEDLDALIRLLNRAHPDPYRFQPREAVEAEHRRAADTMPASLTRADLCVRLSRVLAVIKDGHTSMNCEDLIRREWRRLATAFPPQSQRVLMFPPFMRIDDQDHLVVGWHNDVPRIDPGDRILRVNGQDADALLAEWAAEISHDTDAGRRAMVARRFRLHLTLHGINAPYRLTVAAPGGPTREVTIEGEPVNYQFVDRPKQPPRPLPVPVKPPVFGPLKVQTAFFNYRTLDPDVGYIDFFSILDGLDTASHFRKAVSTLFAQIGKDRPRVLVIDIRENGGGDDGAAAELLRHITRKPFRLLASAQVKRSQEAKDFASSIIRIPFRWLGLQYLGGAEARSYFIGKPGTLAKPLERSIETRPAAEPFFAGPVCVLTGPHTFSAAAEFADAVKTFGLATVVGEETGGQPNSFGNPMPFQLPRSRLTVTMATVRSIRASGHLTDSGAAVPDIIVRTTAEDIQALLDPVLERARTCPDRSIQ